MNAVTGLASVPYSDIPYVPRRWRWRGYLPVATPVIYAAAGGTGKGMLMAAAVARVTLGLPWPGEDPSARHEPARVVWISGPGEDDQFEDISPRLRAAIASAAAEFGCSAAECAAALARVHDLSQWGDNSPVTLPADCGRILAELDLIHREHGPPRVGMVVADSLSAVLSDGWTIDSRQGARRVMGALSRFARSADATLAILHHLTKDGKVAGSPAVLDAVRLAFRIDVDAGRPEVRTIIRHKANASAAVPQQYAITGDEPGTHAVFVHSADARAERMRQAAVPAAPPAAPRAAPPAADARGSFAARLAAAQSGGHRCLVKEGTADGRLAADGVSAAGARAAAELDAGHPLTWRTGPSGMQVATAERAGGQRVSYGVYPSEAR